MSSEFKPLRNICLCELVEEQQDSVLDLSQMKARSGHALRAKVLVAGKGRTTKDGVLIPTEVKEGDIVLFGAAHEASNYDLGENQVLVAEHNILAIEEA